MPIATWKIMARLANQAGYHYAATEQKGWAPSVGEKIKVVVAGQTTWCVVAEISKDHSTRNGIDVFTVRVDEQGSASGGPVFVGPRRSTGDSGGRADMRLRLSPLPSRTRP